MESDQKFPTYVGGGDLWEEPPPHRHWHIHLGWIVWLLIAISFALVALSFWQLAE